jgi:hypothetical protein
MASGMVASSPPIAWRSVSLIGRPIVSSVGPAKTLRPSRSTRLTWTCRPEPTQFREGLGHEGGDDAVAPRHLLDGALQQDRLVAGL